MMLQADIVVDTVHWLKNYFFLAGIDDPVDLPINAFIDRELSPAARKVWDYISLIHLLDEYEGQPTMIAEISNGRYSGFEPKNDRVRSLFINLQTRINFLEIEMAIDDL